MLKLNKMQQYWNKLPITVKATTAYTVCSILQRCLSFITVPLFTRLLTTEQYGQTIIYSSWQGFLSVFLTLNLAYGSLSTAMVKFDNDRDGYLASVEGICLCLTGLFLLLFYFPFRSFWSYCFQLPSELIVLMCVDLLCSTAILLWSGEKRFEYKYTSVVIVTLLVSIISPAASYYFVTASLEKGYAYIAGFAIVNIIIGGAVFIRNIVKGKKLFNEKYWRYALGFNVPLLIYYLAQIIINHSDRIMISHMIGTDKAAIYGVAYSLAIVLTFVLNAINNSYVPWVYEKIKEKKINENHIVSIEISGFIALILSFVIWLAPEIILIIAGERYAEAMYVVPPVAISLLLLFYTQLSGNVLFYFEDKDGLIRASVYAALSNFIFNLLCIKHFGFIAAAYTTLLSFVIFFYMAHIAAVNVLKKHDIEEDFYNLRDLLMLLAAFAITSIIGTMLYDMRAIRLTIVLIAVCTLWIKRNLIIMLYQSMKSG